MTRYLTRDRAAAGAAVMVPLALAAVLLPFRAAWPNTNVALLLVVAVVAVAAIGSRAAGALAALWSAACFDFFFTRPYDRFTIRGAADITTFAVLLAVGVAVSQLAARARRLQVVAVTDEGYLAQLREAATTARLAPDPDAVIGQVRDQLVVLLGLRACRFERGILLGRPPRLEPDGTILAGHARWDVDLSGLPAEDVELRVFSSGQYYGRFMLTPVPGSRPSLQARLVALTLADLAGRALGSRPAAQAAP